MPMTAISVPQQPSLCDVRPIQRNCYEDHGRDEGLPSSQLLEL
jgi:hypothetical protein